MFAAMRTGSNFLEANLNAMQGVTCHGELFNPHFIGQKDRSEFLGFTLADRLADPMAMLRAMRMASHGIAGFRYFHDHDARVFQPVLDDPRCAKIILTRNPAESYVSWKIAQETGQWKLTNAKNLKSAQVRFVAAEFETHLASLQDFHLRILHGLQVTGQTAFYLDYDDIGDLEVLNGLARFLGVPPLDSIDDSLKKQNPDALGRKVINSEEMEAALGRLDRFNLSRTPNFEPRRAPAVPGFLASRGAPLLYMPIKSGPEARVTEWLAALGGVEGAFTQKSLRQWKRARPDHRSFTVIRHPVLRAHAAFCNQILGGTFREIRGQLEKLYRIPLPPIGQDYPDIDDHRAGFLAFLKWLKLNLSGQTALRVDAHWASQVAVLQGFSQLQTPDLVLREDRLAEGLSFLAAEVGLTSFPPLPAETPEPVLTAIYDDEIEAAAQDAYARDYLAFGFKSLQP